MYGHSKILMVMTLLAALGCSGASDLFGGSGSKNKSDDSKKPSDGDVGVPGYLVDPNQIVALDAEHDGTIVLIGRQGVVKAGASPMEELTVSAAVLSTEQQASITSASDETIAAAVLATARVLASGGFKLPLPALDQTGLLIVFVAKSGSEAEGFSHVELTEGYTAAYFDQEAKAFKGLRPGVTLPASEDTIGEGLATTVNGGKDGDPASGPALPADVPEDAKNHITECLTELYGNDWPAAPGPYRSIVKDSAAAIDASHNVDDEATAAPGIVHVILRSTEEIKGTHFNLMQGASIYCLDVTTPKFSSNTIDRACGVQVYEGIDAPQIDHMHRHEKC